MPVEATTTEAQLFAHASTANGGVVGEGPTTLLQAHKAAFFFKLERELEKVRTRSGSATEGHLIENRVTDQRLLLSTRIGPQSPTAHLDRQAQIAHGQSVGSGRQGQGAQPR